MLNMRPRPQDVHVWFAQDVDEEMLRTYLGLLQDDPDWLMIPWSRAASVDVSLLYAPTSEQLDVYLLPREQDGRTVWRRTDT